MASAACSSNADSGLRTRVDCAVRLLECAGLSLSVAESCTGGLLGHVLTLRPGSTAFFAGGVIAYHNEIKKRFVGVDAETLRVHGAVSEATAAEMAVGIRLRMNTDLGLSITGVAGPDGGSEAKPVGLVYTALARAEETIVQRNLFEGSRARIKCLSVRACLDMLISALSH